MDGRGESTIQCFKRLESKLYGDDEDIQLDFVVPLLFAFF